MMNERTLFDAALDIEDLAKRREFLEKACAGDHDLLSRVKSLLDAHEKANSFLELPAVNLDTQELTSRLAAEESEQTSEFSIGEGAELAKGNPDSDDSDAEQIDLNFLKPPTKPGSIGSLGHYEILETIGEGGFGIVLKAFDEKLHRLVAIKVLNPQMAATSPPRKRFLREARAAAAIRHENVVQVYSVEEQPLPYLVMEFIDGQTLQHKQSAQGPLDVPELLHIGRQIAAGLAAAHAQSLIHRDVKPGNILMEKGAEQKVKLTDFGLARAADDASLTRSGMISGTPMYMAPEQALGQTLDHRSDLFSLGSVLYELATGRPPFRAPSTVAVLKRVVDDTPRPIQEIIPEAPTWLVSIINKLLEKKPEDRYQSAKDVADLLSQCHSELQLTGQVTCVPLSERVERVKKSTGDVKADSAASLAKARTDGVSQGNKLSLSRVLVALALGALVVSPVLYGRHMSRVISRWFWPEIPAITSSAEDRLAGLRFDGKDDFIQVPVKWDSPLLTIEAFVTTDESGGDATVWQLSNEERGDKEEQLNLFEATDEKLGLQTFAGITGANGYSNALAPLKRGAREHRAVVFDGDELHYYVNGIWQGKRRNASRDKLQWRMKQLSIGSAIDRTKFFRGTIDQMRVSSVARYTDNFPPISSVASDDVTLAMYNFDEGAGEVLKDTSGNGNDGKIYGGEWIYPAKGLQFDGVDDYVEFKDLGWASNQYTIEAYISQDGGHGNIFQAEGPGGMLHMYLFPSGGGAGINRDKAYKNANGPRPSKARQHLALVYDGKNLNYFVQGKLAGTKTSVSAEATPMALDRMMIGAKLQSDTSKPEFFEGRLEQLRVSKTARYTLPFTPGELNTDDETLALYDLMTGQRDIVKDLSKRSPDGKIVGATWVGSNIDLPQPNEAINGSTADRVLAEWVISTGGNVTLVGWDITIDKLEDLPSDPFQVQEIKIEGNDRLTDLDFERLRGLQKLASISVIGTQSGVTDNGFQRLAKLINPSLKLLAFYGDLPNVTDAIIKDLNRIEHLKVLTLHAAQITNDGIAELSLPNLGDLSIVGCKATPLGIKNSRARLPLLSVVQFQGVQIPAEEYSILSQWSLYAVRLEFTGIRNLDISMLRNHPELRVLSLRGNPAFSDAGVPDLMAFQKLNHLVIDATEVGDEGLRQLQNLPELTLLYANDLPLTDDGFTTLSQFPKLTGLRINDTKGITDASLEHLAKCTSLQSLSIQGCRQLTAAGVRKLREALPKCEVISDFVVTPKEPTVSNAVSNPVDGNSKWSAPVNLGTTINTAAREANPSLTSDELILVFTRGEELFEARRTSRDEPFAAAIKLAGPLPSAKLQTCCISGDGLQVVFSTVQPGEKTQDVMIATRANRNAPFGQPVVLPQSINSAGEDRHPVLSPDGLNLALTSVRNGQQVGFPLIFTRPTPTAEFNPTPTVDPQLQNGWSVITSFSSNGLGLLKTSMIDNVEKITWHTRSSVSANWSEGQPLPAPFDGIAVGAPFLSTDGNAIYFHSRSLPDGQGELDLWVTRRTLKTP